MITPTDVTQFMKTLESRFGKPGNSKSSEGDEAIDVALTVRNGVPALQSIKHTGYLHSSELAAKTLTKIPETFIHSSNQFPLQ